MVNRTVVLFAAVLAAVCVQSETTLTETTSGYTWTYAVNSDGSATIMAVTPMPTGSLVIPWYLGSHRTLRIAPRVFKDCTGLEEVEMPDPMQIIGDEAFMGCTALKKVTQANSLTVIGASAFRECSAMESFSVLEAYRFSQDDSLTIGACAFMGCEELKRLVLPSFLTSVANDAFSCCHKLKDITTPVGKSLYNLFPEQYGSVTNVVVPSGSRVIAKDAFCGCLSLQRVVVPSSVEQIGWCAFTGCTALKKVEFEGGSISAKTIPQSCFQACDSLEEIDIPYGIETIDFEAFGSEVVLSCKSLRRVTIPQTCRSIGGYAFSVPSLESVSIPDAVTNIDRFAFAYCGAHSISVGKGWADVETAPYVFWGCTNLTEWTVDPGNPAMMALNGLLVTKDGKTLLAGANGDVTIPGTVTKVAPYAFYRYKNLASVLMPDGAVEIGTEAFNGCEHLANESGCVIVGDTLFDYVGDSEELMIPEGTRKIDQNAFPQSEALKSVVISDSVEEICPRAFRACSGLAEITIGAGIKTIGGQAFAGCSGLKVNAGAVGDWMRMNFTLGDNDYWTPHFGSGWRLYCNGSEVTELEVPDDVRAVGQFTFWGCASMVDVTIPYNVKTIGQGAFYNCTNLEHVAISDGTHAIEGRAFARCSSLKNLELGKGIRSIAHTTEGQYQNGQYYNFNKYTPFDGCTDIEAIAVGQYVCQEEAHRIFPSAYTNIMSVTICEGVTNIVDSAFKGWQNLTYLSLPNSLTRIGEYAFSDCKSLVGLDSASGLIIPDGVKTICRYAFSDCESLVCAKIGHGIDELQDSIFYGCRFLRQVWMRSFDPPSILPLYSSMFPDNGICTLFLPKRYGSYMRYTSGEWNANVNVVELDCTYDKLKFDCDGGTSDEMWRNVPLRAKIGELPVPVKDGYVFEGWSVSRGGEVNVTKDMTVEDLWLLPLENLGYEAVTLYAVWSLDVQFDIDDNDVLVGVQLNGATDVVVPSRVTEIGAGVFANCWGLQSVVLPKGVTRIGNRAFANSFNMTSVTMPERLQEIDAEAFAGCSSLTNDVVPSCVVSIGFGAFSGCSSIVSVTIPGSVAYLDVAAFAACTSLESLTIMDGCTRIGIGAFEYCASLAEVSIPNDLVIDSGAFRGCDALADDMGFIIVKDILFGWTGDRRDIVIPERVSVISSCAFNCCETVQRVTIHGNVTRLEAAAFGNCVNLKTVVFLGNAPKMVGDVFSGTGNDCCALVGRDSTGWYIANGYWYWFDEFWNSDRVRIDYAGDATVTFDANGGMQDVAEFVEKGALLETLPTCEREGYVLDGWWTEMEGGEQVVAPLVVMRSAVYYAHWSPKRCTIRFNYKSGYSYEKSYGDMVGDLPCVDDRTGYAFDGWWTQEDGGEQVSESTVVKDDAEYFPHWTPITYYVHFNANGGEGEMADLAVIYDEAKTLPSNVFVSCGWNFIGWATSAAGYVEYVDAAVVTNLTAVDCGVVELFATWKRQEVSVVIGEGTAATQLEVGLPYGNGLRDPSARVGYTFGGWFTEPNGGGRRITPDSIVEIGIDRLYALWLANTYTVRFDANGSNGMMDDLVFVYGEEQALSPVSFKLEDYRFVGWTRERDGAICYEDGAVVSNLTADVDGTVTLYAAWEIWTVPMQICEGVFAGSGTVALDENDNIVVTVTNDISGTVEIPDNVGGIMIDLNGHSIVGDGDALGESALPCGPAIRIVSGDGDGETTSLVIVDTSEGEKGQVVGGGDSAGIEIDDDAAPSVRLDVDEGIVVLNGDGTEQDWEELMPVEFTLKAGEYFRATLAELGYDVPTDGVTAYDVKALGLPAGLQLKYNAAVKKKVKQGKTTKTVVVKPAKVEWWIEGVPTAGLDFFTNPPYLVITVNGSTRVLALPVEVEAQEVTELDDLALGQDLNEQFYLPGVTSSVWTVSGLPTGLKYTAKLLTTTKKKGKKIVSVTTNALPYSVYGKTTKAGLFTITAKKKNGAYYETMKFRVLVTPKEVGTARFGEDLTNITTMAYEKVDWDLVDGGALGESALPDDGHAGRVTLPSVAAVGGKVAKVTGLPSGVTFAAADVYSDKKKTKLKQKGQTIVGTPTKPGTYVVTFTKNVKSGKTTVAKTAQILWKVEENNAEVSLGFNNAGGVIESGSVGLKYGDLLAFAVTSNATVTASGLPAGIKLAKLDAGDGGALGDRALPGFATYGFTGFTAKAGTYLVTVKATMKGKTVTQRVALKVDALPAWAKGTFNGIVRGMGNGESGTWNGESGMGATNGLATITLSAAGKISGKFYDGGTNWTFSAESYTVRTRGSASLPGGSQSSATEGDTFICSNVVAKYAYKVKEKVKGKMTTVTKYVSRKFVLVVGNRELGIGVTQGRAELIEQVEEGLAGTRVEAWQNMWGTQAYKTLGAKIFYTSKKAQYKTFTVNGATDAGAAIGLTEAETLSLKVTPAGAVTATMSFDTGKTKKNAKTKKTEKVIYKATCQTVVIPLTAADADSFVGQAFLYFAPSAANGFAGYAGVVPLPF